MLEEMRANMKKFGRKLTSGELLMRIQSEQKFPEDDPEEAKKQKRRIRRLQQKREKMRNGKNGDGR